MWHPDARSGPAPLATTVETDISLGRYYGQPIETTFRDCKDIVGAGEQRVRRVRASVGAFHVCLWTFTMTEAWAWGRGSEVLTGHRAVSPWDDTTRRPSHADKRRAWRREILAEHIHAVLRPGLTEPEIQAAERLLNLAA